MDWTAWALRAEEILTTSAPEGAFRTLFATGAEFSDPVNGPTTDVDGIEAMTRSVYPDWSQKIVAAFGDDRGGAFEWIGTGTLGGVQPTVLHGCTILEINEAGLVTRWRDYFDLREIERPTITP
jgi:hypothetical protein